MKLNSKKVIVILSSVLATVVLFSLLNSEKEEVINTVKVEVDTKPASTQSSSTTPVGGDPEDGIEDPNDEEYNEPILTPLGREVKPYTKPVPEQPDYEASRWNFIDTNNNKVHDYFEVIIVEEFEDDADVVEGFFSMARYEESVIGLARKGELDKDTLSENLSKHSDVFACLHEFYGDSEFNSGEADIVSALSDVFDPYYNTPEKFELKDSYRKASHGIWIKYTIRDTNVSTCRNYFENSINWEIN